LIFALGAFGAANWKLARSEHFELYTPAGDATARYLIRHFETVRDFFQRVMKQRHDPGVVRLVLFTNIKDYEPRRPGKLTSAYYLKSATGDWIVMGRLDNDSVRELATHEYLHLLVGTQDGSLPLWLNEGLAESYQTLRNYGGKVMLGEIPNGTLQVARSQKWIPVRDLLAADHKSDLYHNPKLGGMFHAESWILTHMLMFEPEYMDRFGQFVNRLASGADSVTALNDTYGLTTAEFEQRAQGYMRRGEFFTGLVNARIESSRDDVTITPAPDWQVEVVLAQLLTDHEEGLKALRALRAQQPKRPEVAAALGLYLLQLDQHAEAAKLIEEAYDGGVADPNLLHGLAQSPQAPARKRIVALQKLLAQDPERLDTRLRLARALLNDHQPSEAYATLEPIKLVPPDEAPRFFQLLVELAMERGDKAEAQRALQRILDLPGDSPQKAGARRLMAELQRRETPARTSSSGPMTDSGSAPVLRRGTPASSLVEQPQEKPPRPRFVGRFSELRCGGNQAWIVLDTEQGRKTILLDRPSEILLKGAGHGTLDLTCGQQSPAPRVAVEYDPADTAKDHADGLVRTIEWLR